MRNQRACFKPECPRSFADHFARREQKQVDVHIAVDLMTLAECNDLCRHIAIASDDTDLLPAIAAAGARLAANRTLTALRFSAGTRCVDGICGRLNSVEVSLDLEV
jgi:hypothetical protein